jgi:hypothetical protein
MSLNLNELEAAVGKMTPGEWVENRGRIIGGTDQVPTDATFLAQFYGTAAQRNADTAGCCMLRNAAPELIAAAREREELKAKLAEEVRRTQYWMHEALSRDSDGDERDAAVRGVVAQRDELAALLRRVLDSEGVHLGVRLADDADAALAKVGP